MMEVRLFAEMMARAVVANQAKRAKQDFNFDSLSPGLQKQLIDDQLAALQGTKLVT